MSGELRVGTAAGRWVIVATVLGSGMALLDSTVVNVALPRIGRDLHTSFAGLQWVVNGYALALASLILIGGSLGDRLGRRKVFLIGVVWFAVASLLCGLAQNAAMLIGSRVLQGIGGALLTPGSLAILQSAFVESDRSRAIGAWSGFGGIAAAVGPLLGGWLVDAASWRWVFLINVPMAVVVIVVAVKHVPESSDSTVTGRLDLNGAVLGAVGLAAGTYGLIARSWPIGAAGIGSLAAFLIVERSTKQPMLPLGIFANRRFSATNAVTFVVYGALGMLLFMLGITLQTALGYSPLRAGAATLPFTAMMLLLSARSGALAEKIGPRLPMTFGPLLIAAGLLLMIRVEPGRSYGSSVLPAVLVFGCGLVSTVAPLTSAVLASVDDHHAGLASGVNNAIARSGGLLAVASLPLLAGFDPSSSVSPGALINALHRSALVAAGLCGVGAALSWMFVGSELRSSPTAV